MRNLLYQAPALVPPTVDEVVAALLNARMLIQQGWSKRQAVAVVDGRPCYCVVAAITACSHTTQIRDAAMAAARIATPPRYRTVSEFNDAARGVGDVADMLRRAAGYARHTAA